MAQAGQNTLIIDADLRKPKVHAVFNVNRDKGLSGFVSGRISEHEAIRSTEVNGLSMMAAGREVPNPSELLNSPVFNEKIRELSLKYDRIVIDSPPVLAVTDSRILAATCDVTLLVLRANKSTRKTSRHACESLLGVGARLLGVIVNDVSARNSGYGYYGGYGHKGNYGYGHEDKAAG
jgi:capsular exopolysaccharide synthesis family protein